MSNAGMPPTCYRHAHLLNEHVNQPYTVEDPSKTSMSRAKLGIAERPERRTTVVPEHGRQTTASVNNTGSDYRFAWINFPKSQRYRNIDREMMLDSQVERAVPSSSTTRLHTRHRNTLCDNELTNQHAERQGADITFHSGESTCDKTGQALTSVH